MKTTCHINFCWIVRVIPRISLQNLPNLSQEIEKNTENVMPFPLPYKKLEIASSIKGQCLA